jgi:hypothetical protein
MQRIKKLFNRWSIIIFLGTLSVLCVISILVIALLTSRTTTSGFPTASFLIIPAPSLTPTVDPLLSFTPTPDGKIVNGVGKGSIVQIHGTEGAGLRLRSGPGTGYNVKFVAMDAELYEVKDGPVDSDGYVWWFLVSPYDENRSGWAAADYLSLVTENP